MSASNASVPGAAAAFASYATTERAAADGLHSVGQYAPASNAAFGGAAPAAATVGAAVGGERAPASQFNAASAVQSTSQVPKTRVSRPTMSAHSCSQCTLLHCGFTIGRHQAVARVAPAWPGPRLFGAVIAQLVVAATASRRRARVPGAGATALQQQPSSVRDLPRRHEALQVADVRAPLNSTQRSVPHVLAAWTRRA